MLDLLFKAFADLVAFFYRVIPSYGVAIVALTVAVRLVLFPLTAKQAKSMLAMQRVQPELKRLQAKYKNDRQKLNEEMMKFYKENQINPLAGCLPLLLQLPLFIVLYRVIAGLTHTVLVGALVMGGTGTGPLKGAEIRDGAAKISAPVVKNHVVTSGTLHGGDVVVDGKVIGTLQSSPIKDGKVASATVVGPSKKSLGTLKDLRITGDPKVSGSPKISGDPKYIRKSSELYKALQKAGGKMVSWGIDLSKTAGRAAGGGFGGAIPYYILVLLVAATGWYQQRQMTAKNPQAAANPQAQMMGKMFPLMFALISLNIAAGVVVYFIVSNLWQIGQQAIVYRQPAALGASGGVVDAKSTNSSKGSKPPKGEIGNGRRPSGRTTSPSTPPAKRNKGGK